MRACTDFLCVIIFGVAVAGLGAILVYAKQNGDMNKISRGYNYDNKLCGVGDLAAYPYIFYCMEPITDIIDVKKPVCLATCPTDESPVQRCALGAIPAIGYPSVPVADRTCMPTGTAMVEKVSTATQGSRLSGYALKIAELPEAGVALTCSILIAFIAGYLFLLFLDLFAFPLVWGCLLTLIAVPCLIGAYLVWISKLDGKGFEAIPPTGLTQEQDFHAGCGAAGLGALMALMACCSSHGIEKAVECVQMACEAIFAQSSMLLAPAIEIATKILLMIPLLGGLMLLCSVGEMHLPADGSGYGVLRTFTYTPEQWGMIAYYVLMILWLMELVTSTSQFAVAYAVQAWYFTAHQGDKKVGAPTCGICAGYALAATVHFGTLAFGSFLIATLRFLRMLIATIAEKEQAGANPIAACIGSICVCVVDCFERFLQFINKTAYIETAINGTSFCVAGVEAISIIAKEVSAVAALHGATFILQFAGTGAIAMIGAGLTWVMCSYIPFFSAPSSEHHVEDPLFMTGAAGVFSFIIGAAFMNVFDTAADTMLFCFATEKKNAANEKPAPPVQEEKSGLLSFLSCARKPPPASNEKPTYSTGKLRSIIAQHRT